jgi:prolyl-tRNA editing enzyme YbaK/EbsC (Cys-tRNA(Pro) deacylase)
MYSFKIFRYSICVAACNPLFFSRYCFARKISSMSVDAVRTYLDQWGRGGDVMEFPVSSATVELAALALKTQPARIAKTLSFATAEGCLLIVTAGDARIDNKLFKAEFGMKARMLDSERALLLTGHAVGGVCPFALPSGNVEVYADVSLKRFTTVFPACGSANSAIEVTPEQLGHYAGICRWVDVCSNWKEPSHTT